MSTFPILKRGEFDDAFNISKILLNDDHDLIHLQNILSFFTIQSFYAFS